MYTLLTIVVLNLIYQIGYFFTSAALNVSERHYFLGFNPRLFAFEVKGVKFTVGLYIPIVGLARVYSIVDDKKHRARYPFEFFDQSILKRFIVTMSGACALFLTGLLTIIGVNYFEKESIISKDEVNRHGIYASEWTKKIGFQTGDKIIAVNGRDYEQFYDLIDPKVLGNPDSYYTIRRGSNEVTINI